MSAGVAGRRNARFTSVDMILLAQVASSRGPRLGSGRQTKILRRLAVSAAPCASNGPSIVTWPTWG